MSDGPRLCCGQPVVARCPHDWICRVCKNGTTTDPCSCRPSFSAIVEYGLVKYEELWKNLANR